MNSLLNFIRLFNIAVILARHDALFLLDHLGLGRAPRILSRIALPGPRRSTRKLRKGQKLVNALQELGPSFIKFGQSWSTRSDLIGEETAKDLAQLRDRLPPFDTKEVYTLIEKAFGKSVDELFTSFEDTPVAAASIAQVHLAITSTGDEVAVKVLRPGIEDAFRRDIRLFMWLAQIVDSTQEYAARLKPIEIVKKFEETCTREMDLSLEAAAASELAHNFLEDEYYYVPTVNWGLTSTRILTLERVNGLNLGDVNALIEAGIDRSKLVENLLKAFLLQIFRDGFFHADMHPGNLFTDSNSRILAVDFGIMGRVDVKTRLYLAELMLAFLTRDYKRAAEVHFEAGYVPKDQSLDEFAQSCRAIGESVLGKSASEVSIARMLYQLIRTTEYFKMETQPQLLLLQKTLVVAEGVARSIEPDTVLWDKAKPIIEEWMIKNLNPTMRLRSSIKESIKLLRRVPELLDNAEFIASQMTNANRFAREESIAALRREQERHKRRMNLVTFAAFIAVIAVILFL